MHTHCLPVSRCAKHYPEELPRFFKDKGIDAIVLTNHYYNWHCNQLSPDLNEQANIYLDTYYKCRQEGEKIGFNVFFGAEIKLINEPNKPEFLLYGLSEEVFLSSYPLYYYSQSKLYDFCNQNDILMVQAHPYREEQKHAPADMRYMHGIEVYNPHPSFEARFEETLDLAIRNKKIKTAGSDFHKKIQAGSGGTIVPDNISDQFMLRDFLRKGNECIFDKNGIIYNSDLDNC